MNIAHYRLDGLFRRMIWKVLDRFKGETTRVAAQRAINSGERLTAAKLERNPGSKLKVGFLVADEAKWSAAPLFEALNQQADMEAGFYTMLSDVAMREPLKARQLAYAQMRAFFSSKGEIWRDLYDQENDCFAGWQPLDCDVLFIQQPWGLQEIPRQLSIQVLCAYFSYGFVLFKNDRGHFGLPNFHQFLWRYYTQHPLEQSYIRQSGEPAKPNEEALILAGYPKMDVYRSKPPARTDGDWWPHSDDGNRFRVVIAPHHSVGKKTLNLSTLHWSMEAISELCSRYRGIDFILKPHPNFRYTVNRSRMISKEALKSWLKEWHARENCAVRIGGDYFKILRTSDLLITDSVSFLAEYLPTGAPIIHLSNRDSDAPKTPLGKLVEGVLYKAQNKTDLMNLFGEIYKDRHDRLRDARTRVAEQFRNEDASASLRIIEDLRRLRPPQGARYGI